PSLVEARNLLTIHDNIVLIETMFMDAPPNIETILFLLQTNGYQPLLAHPERYYYVNKKLDRLEPFRERNCLLQANALSFTGYYGKREQEIAFKLLDADLIDFIGSDMHHVRHLKNMQNFVVP